jgi:DNA-binding FadR family transcriptional regulator
MVYERILSKIVDGEFAAGSKLPTEHALSETLKVSRPVLRQALKQLREDGVVTSRQGSGSYVTGQPDRAILTFAPVGSIADIQRTFEFRAAVESEAAWLAAQRRRPRDMEELKHAIAELDRCVRDGDLGVDADERFHAAVCQAADNQYFQAARASMQSNIITGMNLTRNLSMAKSLERLQLVQAEHYAILEAIDRQKPDAARLAMRNHIDNARRRVFDG